MILKLKKTRSVKSPTIFGYVAVLLLAASLLQPFTALADEVIINDANVENPAEQSVEAGTTNPDMPVITDVVYSTSTPETVPPTEEPEQQQASSTLETLPEEEEDQTSSSTPDTALLLESNPCASDSTTTPTTEIESGSNQPCEQTATTSEASTLPENIDAPESTNNSTTTVEIINTNEIDVKTVSTSTANSGLNEITASDDIKDTHVETGDVNVYANVLTVANVNLVNSEIIQLNDTFNKLAADLYFNQTELTPGERTQDLVSPICSSGNVSCESMTSFKLTNQNTADVKNDVVLNGNSGGNSLETDGGDIKDTSITTGNVNAVVNVLNIVNTNAINSRWTLVTFNVFGGWKGDLIMPSELYFTDIMSIGADNSNDISQVTKVILNVNNTNHSDINNEVAVNTGTGDNSLQTMEAENGLDGDVKDSTITTGNSSALSNAQNISNITVYNSRWFLGLINIMGDWSGNVYSLPDSVAVNYMPTGFSFVSSPDPEVQAQLLAQIKAPVATTSPTASFNPEEDPQDDTQNEQVITTPDDETTASSTTETIVDLTNSNQAEINNKVTINAITGSNSYLATGDIKRNSIQTGNATALANILNFANTNLINADLYVGLINIFGDWDGNIVFGYPDLTIDQSAADALIPAVPNAAVNVKVSFQNPASASIAGSKLEWKYNPALFSLNSVNSPYPYSETVPGQLVFDIGRIAPHQSGDLDIQLKTLLTQAAGMQNEFFARIFGNGAETNDDNNQDVLNIPTDNSGSQNPPPANPPPGGSTGGQTGNNNQGNSGQNNSQSSSGGGGGGGGGAISPNSIGVIPDLVRIYKKNDAPAQLKPGYKVHFTITLDNDGNNTINNLVVYDTLKGPDGSVINSQVYNAGKMLSRQEIKFSYDLIISKTALPGLYTNSAYAEGLNERLQPVRSQVTALSTFMVIPASIADANKTAEELLMEQQILTNSSSSTSSLATIAKVSREPEGTVLGDICVQPAFSSDLKLNIKNKEVKALAVFLNNNGFVLAKKGTNSAGKESDVFGTLLRSALIKFQKANKIKEQGIVGAETRAKLNALFNPDATPYCPPPPFQFTTLLRQGANNLDVLKLQQWLNTNGFIITAKGVGSPGKESRAFGALTKTALIKLQRAVGIRGEDGTLGAATRAYINLKLVAK